MTLVAALKTVFLPAPETPQPSPQTGPAFSGVRKSMAFPQPVADSFHPFFGKAPEVETATVQDYTFGYVPPQEYATRGNADLTVLERLENPSAQATITTHSDGKKETRVKGSATRVFSEQAAFGGIKPGRYQLQYEQAFTRNPDGTMSFDYTLDSETMLAYGDPHKFVGKLNVSSAPEGGMNVTFTRTHPESEEILEQHQVAFEETLPRHSFPTATVLVNPQTGESHQATTSTSTWDANVPGFFYPAKLTLEDVTFQDGPEAGNTLLKKVIFSAPSNTDSHLVIDNDCWLEIPKSYLSEQG